MTYYRIRSLFPRKILRYIDWFFIRDSIKVYGGISLKDALSQIITPPYLGKYDVNERHQIIKDITNCFLRYGTTPRDYFLFGFDTVNTSAESRASFVTDWDKDDILIKEDGWDKYLELSEKYGFYKKAGQYYGRKLFLFKEQTSKESAMHFILEAKDLFIKPQGGSYGHGAFVASCENDETANELYEQLKEKGGIWILEERIIQDEEMAKWNSSSVNTVRFTSILSKSGFHGLTPFFRTGRVGKIVDNAGSGGILVDVELETGRIYTDGIDEDGNVYVCHPDTGITFKGATIPHWDLLLKTVKEAHETAASNHKYIGWDLALSKGKWIVVEGNWGQFINQYADKKGRKQEFLKYIKDN